jgi:hypothetical protein
MVHLVARRRTVVVDVCVTVFALALLSGCTKQDESPSASPSPPQPEPEVAEAQAAAEPTPAQQPEGLDTSALGILYVGHPGSEREKDFVEFLDEHFDVIETADLKTFAESQCDGFDVTILDYDGDGFKAPRPEISPDFSRPLITIGVPGALICSTWRLKTGYL